MREEAVKSKLPDVGDFVFLFGMQIGLFILPNLFFTDGSTGWHLVAGDYIIKNFAVPHTDLFRRAFPIRRVAYEWLFDILMALIVRMGGFKLLAVILSATVSFLFLSIYDRGRRAGAGITVSSILVAVAILISCMHWLARPHIVTFWGVYIFSCLLMDFFDRGEIDRKSSIRLISILSVTMLIWVNCHPSFPIGLVIVAIYAASSMLGAFMATKSDERELMASRSRVFVIAGAVLFAVSFVNPYGIALHTYILNYLGGSELIQATDEYLSPVFKGGLHATCLEILFFAFAFALYRGGRLSMPAFLNCLFFGHLALSAVRFMPLFAIVATPAILAMLGQIAGKHVDLTESAKAAPAMVARISSAFHEFSKQEAQSKAHIIPIVYTAFLAFVAITGGSFAGKTIVTSTFDPASMPVETTAYIEKNGIDPARVFNFDNWGGYLRYKTGKRVFIDDRADFYGHEFYARYSVVTATGEDWKKLLDTMKVDWVLFPPSSKLAQSLLSDPSWSFVASDQSSNLFERRRKTENR